jgi:hypothetical protein
MTYYLGGKEPGCRLVRAWNLMVPADLEKKLEIH